MSSTHTGPRTARRRSIRALCLVPVLALLSGCVISVNDDDDDWDDSGWKREQRANLKAIEALELGLSRSEIESEMGAADLVEVFQRDGARFVVLRYRTQRRRGDGETTADETTPLVFVDGRLVGWGESAVEFATVDR